jgi:HEAT repeat protein
MLAASATVPAASAAALVILLLSAKAGVAQSEQESPGSYGGKTVAQWVEDLGDLESKGADDKRRRAAYALGRIGPAAKSAIGALIKVVNDPNMEPRWYAADALGRIGGGEQVAGVLAGAIRNPENDVYVRLSAVKSLGRLGQVAAGRTDVLVEQLDAEDAAVRAAAALSLWQVAEDPQAISTLKSMLQSDSSDQQFYACIALEEVGDAARPAVDQLVHLLGSDNPDVRRAASKTLGGLGFEAARAVRAAIEDPANGVNDAAAAVALGFVADHVRRQVLYSATAPAPDFNDAVRALLDELAPPLVKLLESPDETVRREAGRALARFGPLSVPGLLTALGSDDKTVRTSAAEALIRVERYLPVDSPSANVEGLKKYLVRPLVDAIGSETFELRYGAIRAAAALNLGSEADPMKPLLSKALEDEDAGIRRYAAQALASIKAAKDSN